MTKSTDSQIETAINELQELVDAGGDDAENDSLRALLAHAREVAGITKTPAGAGTYAKRREASSEALYAFEDHLKKLIADRNVVITGFGDHGFSDFWAKRVRQLDAPLKYSFQTVEDREKRIYDYLSNSHFMLFLDTEEVEALYAAIRGEGSYTFTGSHDRCCGDCTARMDIVFSGNTFAIGSDTPCEKNISFSFEVDFPTGEVVYADWPDRFGEATANAVFFEPKHGSVNYLKGQREATEGYAKLDMVHVSVGNSSPSLYVSEDGTRIQCGDAGYDENDERIVPEGMKEVGYFCTDLWWTTMLDKKHYDAIITKLPENRPEGHYEKAVETAKIEPGRYRFTVLNRYANAAESEDEYFEGEGAYWVAERIGPCQVEEREWGGNSFTFMTPAQYSKTLFGGRSKFSMFDYVFNVIGNGLRSKGELFAAITYTGEAPPPAEFSDAGESKNPYPNFQKQYSTIYEAGVLEGLPEEWLDGVMWYYEACLEYFNSPGVSGYHYAYNGDGKDNDNFLKGFERVRKPGMTEAEFHAEVSKQWECEYTGDIEDFRVRNWAKEKARIIKFIEDTMWMIAAEIDRRG